MAQHNDIGALGEGIACEFLVKQGFKVIERNYWRKWGEIDIVTKDSNGILHFIEVKSTGKPYTCNLVGESEVDDWRPEEMVHAKKIQRLKRVIQTYILQNSVDDWVFDIVVVYINKRTRMAKCRYIKDIIL